MGPYALGLYIKWVVIIQLYITGSNHYGIAGWYSMQALKHGLLVSYCKRFARCSIFLM